MRKRFFTVLLCALLALLLPRHSSAETEYFDFSNDFSVYAQAVAQLNQPLPMPSGLPGEEYTESYMSVLLCRTDGAEVDFEPVSALYVLAGPNHCYTLFFSSDEERDAAVELLNQTNGVLYAEADCDVIACGETAPVFQSWGAEKMGFGSYIDYAETNGSGSAVVAVIDSGCFPHPMMQDRILFGGTDYVDADMDPSNDLFGHGTNVAGILADCTADAPVYLYPIRVLNSSGTGKMSNVVNAVREASKAASIINMSLESFTMSASLDDAIREAVASGVIVVAAAGNSGRDTASVCPAHLTDAGVIVVGSAEGGANPQRASYSNYGVSVDVYAFGTGIRCCSRSGGYSTGTGTSMAAPHISAACALMRVLHPGMSPGEAEYRLRMAAEGEGLPIPDLTRMIPQTVTFSLNDVRLWCGGTLRFPAALPESACEEINLSSSDASVIRCQGSSLTAIAPGTAEVTCSCPGLEDIVFKVTVMDSGKAEIVLPASLTAVDTEAFFGDTSIISVFLPEQTRSIGSRAFDGCPSLCMIQIPVSVTEIGENTFSNAVILCRSGSEIHSFAEKQNLQYIAIP